MAQQLVCPECRAKLYLRKPAVAATKVKCRECSHKFYVGHSLEQNAATIGRDSAVAQKVAAPSEPARQFDAPDEAREEPAVTEQLDDDPKVERRRERRKSTTDEVGMPKWLVPAGLATLGFAVVLAIFYSSKPPEAAKRNLSAGGDTPDKKPAAIGESSKLLGGPVKIYARPPELCGTWVLESDPTSRIELTATGSARVDALLVEGTRLVFEVNWYLVTRDGNNYTLELGKEPSLATNHRTMLNLEKDGRLRMTIYALPVPNGITKVNHLFKQLSSEG